MGSRTGVHGAEQAGVPGMILPWPVPRGAHAAQGTVWASQDGAGEAGPAALGALVPGKPSVPWDGANLAQPWDSADTELVLVDHPTTFPRTLMLFPCLRGRRAPGGNLR